MNGNTYFNFRFYNPLPVWRQQVAAANSEALSHFGSHSASEPRKYFVDHKGIFTTILRTWVQNSTLFLQNRGHAEVVKKAPSSAKYVTRVRPPSVPEYLSATPPPPPPPRIRVRHVYISDIHLLLNKA